MKEKLPLVERGAVASLAVGDRFCYWPGGLAWVVLEVKGAASKSGGWKVIARVAPGEDPELNRNPVPLTVYPSQIRRYKPAEKSI